MDGLSQCFQKFQYHKRIPHLFFIDFAPSKEISKGRSIELQKSIHVYFLLLQGKKDRGTNSRKSFVDGKSTTYSRDRSISLKDFVDRAQTSDRSIKPIIVEFPGEVLN